MAKDNCILLSNSLDLALVLERLEAAYGESALKIEGDRADWQRVAVSRRKLLWLSQVTFVPMTAAQLAEIQKRLRHVYSSVHPEIPALHTKLMVKIATSRLAIEVQAPKGLRGMEEVVFEVSNALDAVIFWEGSKMLDKKGQLVMDFEGHSGVGDLEVTVDASLLDQHTPVSEEGKARKARSEEILKQHALLVNKSLPPIAGEQDARLRSQQAVAERALALMLVAVKGEGLEDEIVQRVMADYGIAPLLSPNEQAFIQNQAPSQQDRINFIWRYESLATLLWALGFQQQLTYPDAICDVPSLVTAIRESGSYEGFLAASKLRSATEILDQTDLIYRIHWAVVDARLRGLVAPGGIEAGVVYERHYALNWLTCYFGQAWDDVRTDT